jgi:DNA-binding NarL/FixJ family response regulator
MPSHLPIGRLLLAGVHLACKLEIDVIKDHFPHSWIRLVIMTIRLIIADDHEIIRLGLRTWLGVKDIRIMAEASTGDAAFKLAKKHRPDVAVLDVEMPDGDGLSCLTRIKLDLPDIHVLIFSSVRNPQYLARALALGAAGYLSKRTGQQELTAAVRLVASGQTVWSRSQLRGISYSGLMMHPHRAENPLTLRESDVIRQLALGATNKQIANILAISCETVKEHVQHILQKIGASDRTQAAVWAVRNNLA